MVQYNHNRTDSLTLLGRYGDPLERQILTRREDLDEVLRPYAEIWSQFVYPRQEDLQSLAAEDRWVRFAGSHYTALISVDLALEKLRRIMQICHQLEGPATAAEDPQLVLELYDVTEGFWRHTDRSARFLLYAIEDAPLDFPVNGGRKLESRWLRSAPGTMRDTLLTFYRRVPEMIRKKIYQSHYPQTWRSFLSDISYTWRALAGKLVAHNQPLASLAAPLPFPIQRAPAPPPSELRWRK